MKDARFDASAIIKSHLENVKNYMTFQMEAYGRNASGKHVDGLKVEVESNYGVLTTEEPYSYLNQDAGERVPVIECGRAEGRIPRDFQSILFQWVKDKGIQLTPKPYKRKGNHKWSDETERAQWDFAGAVAHNIMMKGTRLYQSGVREDIYSSIINTELDAIARESNLRVLSIIENVNKNAL